MDITRDKNLLAGMAFIASVLFIVFVLPGLFPSKEYTAADHERMVCYRMFSDTWNRSANWGAAVETLKEDAAWPTCQKWVQQFINERVK